MEQEKTVNVASMARIVGYSPQTVRGWAREGLVPSIQSKKGGKFTFVVSDVLAALNKPKGKSSE